MFLRAITLAPNDYWGLLSCSITKICAISYCLIFEIRKVMDLCVCVCVCVCVDAVSEKGLFCEAIQQTAHYF